MLKSVLKAVYDMLDVPPRSKNLRTHVKCARSILKEAIDSLDKTHIKTIPFSLAETGSIEPPKNVPEQNKLVIDRNTKKLLSVDGFTEDDKIVINGKKVRVGDAVGKTLTEIGRL